VKDLNIYHYLGGVEVDLLIGGGAVATTNCVYVGFLEHGQAPNFQRAAREGKIQVNEYSEYLFAGALRAADMGLPFIAWKTPGQSDIAKHLGYQTITDPYSGTELLAVPAIELDYAVIQVDRADEDGYVEYPDEPDLVFDHDWLVARVAKHTIVCAEEVAPMRDPARVAVIGREVSTVVEAAGGSWPCGLHPRYEPDLEHLLGVYMLAASEGDEAFAAYLAEHGSPLERGNGVA
jgi:glutaconate CoA-transferase subunit A